MAESSKPYLSILRDTLDFALNLRNFPSQIYEKINRPQVEVRESMELVMKPIILSRSDEDKIEIEPSINSVRINVVIKKHLDLEELLMNIYSNFLMNRADKLNVLRKKAKDGFDISFLVTNYHLENYKKEEIIDFIVECIQDLEKEITGLKLIVNSQCRMVSTYFLEQFKI